MFAPYSLSPTGSWRTLWLHSSRATFASFSLSLMDKSLQAGCADEEEIRSLQQVAG